VPIVIYGFANGAGFPWGAPFIVTYAGLLTYVAVVSASSQPILALSPFALALMLLGLWFAMRLRQRLLRIFAVAVGMWVWWAGTLAAYYWNSGGVPKLGA
jgi:hypothetical protein